MDNKIKAFVEILKNAPYYQSYFINDKPLIVYEDHRFIVPILWLARKNNLISYPMNLIYFDKHNDALDLKDKEKKIESISNMEKLEEVFRFVEKELKPLDDDWLTTLMNLEIVKDAVVIGDIDMPSWDGTEYKDLKGNAHILKSIDFLEGSFNFQGKLSDLARRQELELMWEIIGWQYIAEHGFIMRESPILLDFDLDYFTHEWRGRCYAWREDFYKKEFNGASDYFSTKGWSGEKFLNQLIKRAPFITIAQEPKSCGGKAESDDILQQLNKKFFNGAVS